ncbi:hypothetical protein TSUD_93570 [Trifolium subterraneum]|uniref:CR-type domain-containing protein n=1 Tax=Trifolium subterraneum TaxID=3900 RepID=A0A2Z6MUJ0_TRISU|nr:hypothetical protein TSUD_93570 [Trifolium subterraneum]
MVSAKEITFQSKNCEVGGEDASNLWFLESAGNSAKSASNCGIVSVYWWLRDDSCDSGKVTKGSSMKISMRQLGADMIQQMQQPCNECKGNGEMINYKERSHYARERRLFNRRKLVTVGNLNSRLVEI